ncbi:MAG: YtxH domain-containing protein [Anaerolineae bacterium]|nr:YtxH domain-containing protein [Thermoflexales bacterium]MDW8406432.1 YtxH domain-containing protein [Anaerolineae bacterium]
MTSNKLFSFLSGILIGGLIGSAAGLLLAAQSGKQLQAEIKREIDAVLEEGRRAAATRRAELERQLAEMRGDKPSGA